MATDKNNLQDNLKKYFYSGVGLAAHTAEAFQKSFKELARKGKVSEADGKKIVQNAIKKVEARRPEIEAKYNAAVHQFMKSTTAEISKLQKTIHKLEGQLRTRHSAPDTAEPRAANRKKRTTGKTKRTTTKKTTTTNGAPTATTETPDSTSMND